MPRASSYNLPADNLNLLGARGKSNPPIIGLVIIHSFLLEIAKLAQIFNKVCLHFASCLLNGLIPTIPVNNAFNTGPAHTRELIM
jgi:hypothetical protein